LVAPSLTGNGQLAVTQGNGNGSGPGWVRLEGFSISNGFQFPAGTGFVARGSPVDAATMIPSGSVRVVAVAGMPVPIHPSGSFALPDVAINAGGPVNVDIEARGIPPGTVVTLRVMVETPADLTELYMPDVQATLQGSTQLSTATVQFAFPYGFSRGHVRARWTQ
jgi:hypothetical protein